MILNSCEDFMENLKEVKEFFKLIANRLLFVQQALLI
jgi:hypothetical protein